MNAREGGRCSQRSRASTWRAWAWQSEACQTTLPLRDKGGGRTQSGWLPLVVSEDGLARTTPRPRNPAQLFASSGPEIRDRWAGSRTWAGGLGVRLQRKYAYEHTKTPFRECRFETADDPQSLRKPRGPKCTEERLIRGWFACLGTFWSGPVLPREQCCATQPPVLQKPSAVAWPMPHVYSMRPPGHLDSLQ